MDWNWKEWRKQKTLFKTIYCLGCKQRKVCGMLTDWDSDWKNYCCVCYYESEQVRAEEYSNYQQVYQQKVKEQKDYIQQLLLLRKYLGCSQCRSKEVDAYFLYENSRLVCQPCRMRKEDGSSGSVSFLEKSKWYKRHWKIDLAECLENYQWLPVNKNCADKWLKDKNHLNKCDCLEIEAQTHYSLVSDNLKRCWEKLKKCKCEKSAKLRVKYIDSEGSGWIYCEKCERSINSAGHHGVIKNWNDPRFWGLEVKEKVLCLKCLGKFRKKMPVSKKYTLNKYLKRGYV